MTPTVSAPRPPSRPRRRLRIPLTPLIDVVFILLVFFMLASSFHDWREIRVGQAGGGSAAPGLEGALLVELTPSGPRLSGEPLAPEALRDRIAARLAERPGQRILVRPAGGVDMQAMVRLLDALAAAGARDVALLPGRG